MTLAELKKIAEREEEASVPKLKVNVNKIGGVEFVERLGRNVRVVEVSDGTANVSMYLHGEVAYQAKVGDKLVLESPMLRKTEKGYMIELGAGGSVRIVSARIPKGAIMHAREVKGLKGRGKAVRVEEAEGKGEIIEVGEIEVKIGERKVWLNKRELMVEDVPKAMLALQKAYELLNLRYQSTSST